MKVYLLVSQDNDTGAYATPGEWRSGKTDGVHDGHAHVVPCVYVNPRRDPKCESARVQVHETWVSSARRGHSYGV